MRVSPFFWISVAAQGMRHGRRLAWNRCRFGQSRFMRHRRRSLWNRRRFDSVVAILAISSSTCIAAAGSTISPSTRRYRHRLDEKLLCDLADDYFRNIAIVSIASSFEGLRKPNKGRKAISDAYCSLTNYRHALNGTPFRERCASYCFHFGDARLLTIAISWKNRRASCLER